MSRASPRNSSVTSTDALAAQPAPTLGDFLHTRRVVIDLEVSSRKRLFEQMAKLLCDDGNGSDDGDEDGAPDFDKVLHTLTKREKLGCTGIGNGIALPHGRIEGLQTPRIAVARLKEALPYEAADGKPVWLAVGILAPQEADETHLQLLAQLAAGFSTQGFTATLKSAQTPAQLTAHLKNIPPPK